jgi:hypothetical protein
LEDGLLRLCMQIRNAPVRAAALWTSVAARRSGAMERESAAGERGKGDSEQACIIPRRALSCAKEMQFTAVILSLHWSVPSVLVRMMLYLATVNTSQALVVVVCIRVNSRSFIQLWAAIAIP